MASRAALVAAFFSCSAFRVEPSSLPLALNGASYSLLALNENALSSEIPDKAKSPYLYYLFDESFARALAAEGGVLALELEIASAGSSADDDAALLFGFLTGNDFEQLEQPRLKKTLDSRPLARVSRKNLRTGGCRVSLAFPCGTAPESRTDDSAPRGFLCYAQFSLSVKSAAVVDAQFGVDEPASRFCFPARGGSAGELAALPLTGLSPIVANPSLLLTRVMKSWRSADYEIYAWDQFPNIIFFDTKSYAVQDEFFKRLTFFSEKKGYRGKIVSDGEIKNQHGFNALDFSARTLAAFFSLARAQQFPLNDRELILCEILLANGIIAEKDGAFAEGDGAVISISQESDEYLRRQFIVHEGLHGLFFTHKEFRDYVAQVYNETDPQSVEFLERYFEVTPSLAYDMTDRYLAYNEFMAYLLQQPVSACGAYFSQRIANYIYINRHYPTLAKYVRDTGAQGLVEAARKLSDYLSRTWGFAAGRLW
ncbi:MAG: hypothetical protein Pg6C_07500 [Treponemataceae bacterium]|nr:MAG: hypothetical protein Pg6C_07500 [Treponemataceae bacterium]